jgi:glycosyltransferase involved in cell wall biosynthesis
MAGCRVYLSSSLSDGASTALLEAMWLGCLPVVSDIPANREWIRNGENGLLFKAQSPKSLAACLVRAIKDHDLFQTAFSINQDLVRKEANLICNLEQLEEDFMKMK